VRAEHGMTGQSGLNDDRQRMAWLRRAYYGLDGRWYLKVRERFGGSDAQDVDEQVCASLGRLHVRAWKQIAAVESIDDCRTLGRFVRDVFDVLHDDPDATITAVQDEPAVFEFRQDRCTIFDMALAAGYDTNPRPGRLPGCAGVLALYQGWVSEAGEYAVEQHPQAGGEHGVRCRYVFRRAQD
jgi:hypothetical protein